MYNWVLSLSFRSENSTSTNDHIGVCVSCAKAEQTHGSMAGKAAERQHWFDFNISLSLYSLLFHSEQKCHQKKGQKNVTPLTQPDQMASCLFTLFLPFFPPKSFCFHLQAHCDSIGAGHMTTNRSPHITIKHKYTRSVHVQPLTSKCFSILFVWHLYPQITCTLSSRRIFRRYIDLKPLTGTTGHFMLTHINVITSIVVSLCDLNPI